MLTRQAPPSDFKWQADNIRALRTHLGLSQTALSRELGIRQQTISEWETGMYAPRGASVTILTLLAVSSNFPFVSETEEASPERSLLSSKPLSTSNSGFAPRRPADSTPVSMRSEPPAPVQRLTFEAAKAAPTDRRTGTYSSTYFDSTASDAAKNREIPM